MSTIYASSQPKGFKNYVENVAFVGATGTIGSHVVPALLKNKQFKVTAITREGSNAKIQEGARIAKINYDDQSTIVKALQGQEVLIISMNTMADQSNQIKLIDAAVEAGVKYILPSEWGAETSEEVGKGMLIGPRLAQVREHIASKGASWIGIACGFWYDFSFPGGESRFGFDWDKKEVTLWDDGDRKITSSTWAQVGRGVAALLALKIYKDDASDSSPVIDDWRDKFVHIASFLVSQNDMLASIRKLKPEWEWKVKKEPVEAFYKRGSDMMQKGDFTGYSMMLYSRLFFSDNAGNAELLYGLDNDKLGVPLETIDDGTSQAIKVWDSGYFKKSYQ